MLRFQTTGRNCGGMTLPCAFLAAMDWLPLEMMPRSSSHVNCRRTVESEMCSSSVRVLTLGHVLRPSTPALSARLTRISRAVVLPPTGAFLNAQEVACQLICHPLRPSPGHPGGCAEHTAACRRRHTRAASTPGKDRNPCSRPKGPTPDATIRPCSGHGSSQGSSLARNGRGERPWNGYAMMSPHPHPKGAYHEYHARRKARNC